MPHTTQMHTHTDNLHKISNVNGRIKKAAKRRRKKCKTFKTLEGKHYFLDCSFSWHTHTLRMLFSVTD